MADQKVENNISFIKEDGKEFVILSTKQNSYKIPEIEYFNLIIKNCQELLPEEQVLEILKPFLIL